MAQVAALTQTPVALRNRGSVPLSNISIEAQGFRLFLPQGVSVVSDKGTWNFVRLPSGGFVEIESPSLNSTTLMMIDPRPAVFVPKPAPNSTYSLMEAILSATPGEVKWWRFRSAENLRIDRLLELKFLLQFELSPRHPSIQPIYPVASTTVRGYQFGNPDVAPYEVEVELFNSADRSLALKFQGPKGHGRLVTQETLNAIVASIQTDRPASASPPND